MSWARAVIASKGAYTHSTNSFPSLGSIKKKNSSLNPNASAWTPMTPPPSTEPEDFSKPTAVPPSPTFGEITLKSGVRLGGGVFGPSRVDGRETISRKTVFKPNAVVQKMMENMGWEQGRGLGVDLQGILVPIDTEMPKNIRFNINVEGGRGGIGY